MPAVVHAPAITNANELNKKDRALGLFCLLDSGIHYKNGMACMLSSTQIGEDSAKEPKQSEAEDQQSCRDIRWCSAWAIRE